MQNASNAEHSVDNERGKRSSYGYDAFQNFTTCLPLQCGRSGPHLHFGTRNAVNTGTKIQIIARGTSWFITVAESRLSAERAASHTSQTDFRTLLLRRVIINFEPNTRSVDVLNPYCY